MYKLYKRYKIIVVVLKRLQIEKYFVFAKKKKKYTGTGLYKIIEIYAHFCKPK